MRDILGCCGWLYSLLYYIIMLALIGGLVYYFKYGQEALLS